MARPIDGVYPSWNEMYGKSTIELKTAIFHVLSRCEAGEPHEKFASLLHLLVDDLMSCLMNSDRIYEEIKLMDDIVDNKIPYDAMRKGIDDMYAAYAKGGSDYWIRDGEVKVMHNYSNDTVNMIFHKPVKPKATA